MKANHNRYLYGKKGIKAVINTSNLPTGVAAQAGIKMKANHNHLGRVGQRQ